MIYCQFTMTIILMDSDVVFSRKLAGEGVLFHLSGCQLKLSFGSGRPYRPYGTARASFRVKSSVVLSCPKV